MKIVILSFLCIWFSLLAGGEEIPPHPSIDEFRQELRLKIIKPGQASSSQTCRIYLVHHGSTEWSEIKRLQGWENISLSLKGKKEVENLAEKLGPIKISAIYSSSLKSAIETSEILQEKYPSPLFIEDLLRGEYHGTFEGYYKEEYENHPHFKFYDSLPPEEEIFFPCGLGGESKADVARRVFPFLRNIAQHHPGENIVVVTHGGVFKVLNYYLGNYSPVTGTCSTPYGDFLRIEGEADSLYLINQRYY